MFSRLVEHQAALLEEQQRAWQRLLGLPHALRASLDTRVGSTPSDVVFRTGTLSLVRFRRETPPRYAEPVLLCYALVNRPFILDLQPGKSVVERYLDRGFDVYLLDWGVPSQADSGLTIEDYVRERLAHVIEFVLRRHEAERLHLLGYCMGGTLAALYTAIRPQHVQTLTLLAAPIDFSGKDTLLQVWTDRRYFDVDALLDANGNCPASVLQLCFLAMRPVQNLIEKGISFFEKLDDARFVSNHFAMERWVNDNIPIAGATFREFVKRFYQANELVRGEYRLGNEPIDLREIRCPLLLLTAEKDHLVAPASTLGIREHVGSEQIEALSINAGHVGLVVSSKAHAALWPAATLWLAERSSPRPEIEAQRPLEA